MVIEKIKEVLSSSNDEKQELLYHRYSKAKLENQQLRDNYYKDIKKFKDETREELAKYLIRLYEDVQLAKNDSFKVEAKYKELQNLLVDINKIEKTLNETFKEFSIEEIVPKERYYDPNLHEVSSYKSSKDFEKNMIVKVSYKGFKYKDKVLKKPRVVVAN